ncbi:MAG: cell division protein FtsK [Parcubacteria group bacterium Greene0416_79]|nr:MAG: cell division protein FtsK [Parcubacteria group bacterium Greene0416_79]
MIINLRRRAAKIAPIPNSTKATVGLATMLAAPEFSASEKPLLISLGKDLTGKAHFANLSKMPHLLIAGATGSGKSVTIHTIITSLLFRNSPDDLKLILIDPKRVELTLYNKIPHLLSPVITDAKKTILALKWAAKEMDRRYDILESESVRDIHSYHKNIVEPELQKWERDAAAQKDGENAASKLPEQLPHIVIIIDELADIMSLYPRELEAAVVRLAQMSRATGIHLVLSTQRPSVNVITGLIKANISARIALQVASSIDSRTILDTGGAEKLLGAGDMLFLSGEMSKPARLQAAFVSETEVKKVAAYLARAYQSGLPEEFIFQGGEQNGMLREDDLQGDEEIDDALYEEAREWVIKAGKASTSYLQRRLRIGYSRAARIMDMLEERNVIGPADGSKPREVLGVAPEETDDRRPTTDDQESR